MRIPSGKTNQYIYFVAVDSTDLKTRETGLSSFTVYRSRNGVAEVAYTTPTITEIDSTNMPGVYALLIDEDTTIGASSDSEEYCVHITQASMAPVTRTIELYRRDTTSGQSITVANGCADADIERVTGNAVPATSSNGVLKVDATHFGGTAGTFASGRPEVNTTHAAGTAWGSGAITAASIASNAITSDKIATDAIGAAQIAADAIDASALAADAATEIGTAVWATTTRLLTAGTNIVLAKGTGITGFNDLSAAQVNAEADTALADVGLTTTITGRIDAAISTRLASASYTTPPTANQNADALLDRANAVETGLTPREAWRLVAAACAGKASGLDTTTAVYRNAVADSKDRITATVDENGNRTAVTVDLT